MPDRDLNLLKSATAIRPGQPFYDSDGQLAQLHGVGVQRIDGRFWSWGEDKSAGGTFAGISCYSSDDLATWTSEGHALLPSAGENGSGELTTDHVVERPKVLYNSSTDEFVMFLHVDSADYKLASVGYATSPTPAGPYMYRGSQRPLGNESRDIGVYQEPDGTAYLLSEDRPHGLHIYRLADDYLSVTEVIASTPPHPASPVRGRPGATSRRRDRPPSIRRSARSPPSRAPSRPAISTSAIGGSATTCSPHLRSGSR